MIILIIVFNFEKNFDYINIQHSESLRIHEIELSLMNDFNKIASDIIFLAEQVKIHHISKLTISETIKVEREFYSYCKNIQWADQVSLINLEGAEVLRINYNDGEPYRVPPHELQSKSHRYYFKELLKIENDGIYISPLDLNIENKEIEKPFKPMIRFGKLVGNEEGQSIGYVLINYFGNVILNKLNTTDMKHHGKILMVENHGYWLMGPSKEDEWGFMIKDRDDRKIQNKFPKSWKEIQMNMRGSIKTSEGNFTFTTIEPSKSISNSSISRGNNNNQDSVQFSDNYSWKVISYISPRILAEMNKSLFLRMLYLAGPLFLLMFLASILLGVSREKQKISEEKYRNLVENANVGIYILQDSKFKYVNETFKKLTGYSFSEVSQDSFNMIDIVAPESREFILNRVKTRDSGGDLTYHYTFKCIHKSGTIISLESSTSNITFEGKHAIQGVLRDVTRQLLAEEKLLESENRFRELYDGAPTAYFAVGLDRNISKANRKASDLLGYQNEELIGKPLMDLYSDTPNGKGKAKQLFQKFLKGEPIKDEELQMQRFDGDVIWISLTVMALKDEKGKIVEARLIVIDITKRKQVEKEKEELQEKLKQSERMESLGLLAGGVAHDLNNIIGPIMAYPELIRMDLAKGNPVDKDLDTIMHSAQRAADVIADLLTLTRRGNYKMETLNLNDLVDDFLSSAECAATKRLHPDVSPFIHLSKNELPFNGSIAHLPKVIMNLINNGCESMINGGVLSIETSSVTVIERELSDKHIPDGRYQLLTIEDQGEGISEENLSKIFDPFFTTKIKTGKSGTGLGLSVVYNVLKDHGAHIDVESSLGIGTKFSIYFPETTDKKEINKKDEQLIKGNGSILIIEDREEQRDIATRMLATLGYEVESVESGRDAINYLKKRKPDLLWLDMILEDGMDGLDVYKEVIKTNPDQKTLIVSGYSESDRMKEAMDLGVNGLIQKPYSLNEIGKMIHDILNGNHSS